MNPLLASRTLARLERLVALARRVTPRRRRRHLLRRPGRGIEPGARRDYSFGDDLRMIDWPAYARLERLLIKVPEELPEPRLDLILDGSGSMAHGYPSPHERACLSAAALAACAVAREVRVGLWWAGPVLDRLELCRPGELVRMLRFLAGRIPGGAGQLSAAGARLTRPHGAAILLSDGLDTGDAARAAQRLKNRGFDTLVVLAAPETELSGSLASTAVDAGLAELVDAETGQRRRIPFSRLALDLAGDARAGRARALLALLEEAGIPSEPLHPAAPFEAVALALLRSR